MASRLNSLKDVVEFLTKTKQKISGMASVKRTRANSEWILMNYCNENQEQYKNYEQRIKDYQSSMLSASEENKLFEDLKSLMLAYSTSSANQIDLLDDDVLAINEIDLYSHIQGGDVEGDEYSEREFKRSQLVLKSRRISGCTRSRRREIEELNDHGSRAGGTVDLTEEY